MGRTPRRARATVAAVRNLGAFLLSAAALAPSASAEWAEPVHDRVVLREWPSAQAPARALAYRGERLRIIASSRTRRGVWQHVIDDGRSGWLARPELRAAGMPLRPWRRCASRAVGSYASGRLICGRPLPEQGTGFTTWDFVRSRSPNRPARRWGTGKLVERIEWVAREWQAGHPLGARLLVGDLSRPKGGPFGVRFGGLGHASHQNGLDVDIYYPRADGLEREAFRPRQVDRIGARAVVALIARSHPKVMFVGCRVGLAARGRAQHLCAGHENHVHARYLP